MCVPIVVQHEPDCTRSLELDPCQDVFRNCREWVRIASSPSLPPFMQSSKEIDNPLLHAETFISTSAGSLSYSTRTACTLTVSCSGRCWRGQGICIICALNVFLCHQWLVCLFFFFCSLQLSLVFLFKAAHHQTSIQTIQTAGQGGIRRGEKLHLKKEYPVIKSTTLKSI